VCALLSGSTDWQWVLVEVILTISFVSVDKYSHTPSGLESTNGFRRGFLSVDDGTGWNNGTSSIDWCGGIASCWCGGTGSGWSGIGTTSCGSRSLESVLSIIVDPFKVF